MPRNYEVLANVLLSVDDFRFDRGNSDHKASVHSVSGCNFLRVIIHDKFLIKMWGIYRYSKHEIAKEKDGFYWVKAIEYSKISKTERLIRLRSSEVELL